MQCPDLKKLSAYGEGDLNPREWSDVHKHVQSCPDCREQAESFRVVDELLQHALGCSESDKALSDRILKKLRER